MARILGDSITSKCMLIEAMPTELCVKYYDGNAQERMWMQSYSRQWMLGLNTRFWIRYNSVTGCLDHV